MTQTQENRGRSVSRLTHATATWLMSSGRLDDLMKVNSGDDILDYVMNVYPKENSLFYKGLKYCDFNALFDGICAKRGYYTTVKGLVVSMMKELRGIKPFVVAPDPFTGGSERRTEGKQPEEEELFKLTADNLPL